MSKAKWGSSKLSNYNQNCKDFDRKKKDLKRLEELEDLMMETPFNHPDFEKYVEERNNLLIRI